MKKALINYQKNIKDDEYYTPDYAIKPLLKYLPKNTKKKQYVVWEPTDFGNSNITKILEKQGYKVIKTHIKNFDFLKDKPNFKYDFIVTNPPYSKKDDFIKKAYDTKKPFALLMPLTALEGKKRGNMWRKNNVEVLVFDGRVNYQGGSNNKSAYFNSSWFTSNILPKQLIFEELKKDK